jgi:hypothetical protein
MTEEQQKWFNCLVSKKWCVSRSTDKDSQAGKLIAMVSAKKPAFFHRQVSRITLQVACAGEKPVIMLMSGREIPGGDINLNYQVSPSGKKGKLAAKQTGQGHFFEIRDQSFLDDLRVGQTLRMDLAFPSEPKVSTVEFSLVDTKTALQALKCLSD